LVELCDQTSCVPICVLSVSFTFEPGFYIMGKQGSPEFKGATRAMLGMKDYKITNNDPLSWKRMTSVDCRWNSKTLVLHGLKSDSTKYNSIMLGKRTLELLFSCLVCYVAFSFLILFSYLFLSLKIFNQVQPQIIQVSFRYNQCNFFFKL
jgi:hypothetical protein